MKRIFLSFYFFSSLTPVAGQADSIAFVSAEWTTDRIARGVWWKQCAFRSNLFSSNQYINILEVRNRGRRKFDVAFEKQVLKRTSDFGKATRALAAINGTFFDTKNGGSVDFVRADGTVIHENRLRKDNSRADHQKAAIIIVNGKLRIGKWDGTDDWEKRLKGEDVMVSGPLLIHKSLQESIDSTSFAKTRHPRSAVAVKKKRVLFITVDGRDANAAGMSLYELASILQWLGAVDGINLDGGGSTTLWISGQGDDGVVNFPSDNRVWDHAGERKVANAVVLKN